MARYFEFSFNGHRYEARGTARDTRNGFAHDIAVWDENHRDVTEATCHYLNRTWECYPYETCLHKAIEQMADNEAYWEKETYKREHNCTRLPKGMKGEIENKWYEEYKKACETIKQF